MSQIATCWGYTASSDSFAGYQLSPDVWNAKDPNTRKLDDTTLAANKMDDNSITAYMSQWRCIGLDLLSPVVEAGRKAALCQRVIPGPNEATATDPSYKLGDMTIYVYNSTRTVAQTANRHLQSTTGFQGASFYSYQVNTGALSGVALSAAAISALVLSYF